MHNLRYIILIQSTFALISCSRKDFLNVKPDQSLVVPSTVADCQDLLDNTLYMNGYGNSGYPSLLINGTDEFYCTDSLFNNYPLTDQHAVTWAKSVYADSNVEDWSRSYRVVYYANQVLEVLSKLQPTQGSSDAWKKAKGSALFFRAFAFYQLMQIFAPVYDSLTAPNDLGIPLRLTSDINEKITRGSVQTCYEKIFSDTRDAASLLSQYPGDYPTRPSKASAFGLLTRTALCTYNYKQALAYADSCLALRSGLMDYNTLDKNVMFPFTRTNTEVIFAAAISLSGPDGLKKSITDSVIFKSFDNNDLRKILFFKKGAWFTAKYDENGYIFCGIATDEIYLIRAECQARQGDFVNSMNTLNTLLSTRWITGTYTARTAVNKDDALQQIFLERRKELMYRGLRWTDLRRLNKDVRWAVTLNRVIGGTTYQLPPNSPRYVYAIPDNVIAANPGMKQNER